MSERFNSYPVIFTHVPRSAGTTLVSIMKRFYPKDAQFNFYVREQAGTTAQAMEEFKNLPEQKRGRLKLLQGHTSFGIHQYYDSYTYITLFRDPVERIVSYYYYTLKRPRHYLHNILISNRMRLEDFIASGLSTELDNIQTRQISGSQNVPYGQCTEKMLETAKLNLVRYYAVTGITEHFDESVMLMKRRLGWTYPFYVKQNIIDDRPPKSQIPESVVRHIEQHNALDVQLYRFALERFRATVEGQDESFQTELDKFRKYNAWLQRMSGRPYAAGLGLTLWGLYAKLRRQ